MYFIIKGLLDFCEASPLNRIWLLLLFWVIWPGLMFLVGLIFESRLIPVGKSQSKAFFPGDFAIGAMAVALINLNINAKSPDWWGYDYAFWLFIIIATGLVVVPVIKTDIECYETRAAISPTKILHNTVGYWLSPAILICLGMPHIVDGIFCGAPIHWPSILEFVIALLFYIFCVVVDGNSGASEEDIKARHPSDWRPFWQKKNNA